MEETILAAEEALEVIQAELDEANAPRDSCVFTESPTT